MAHDFLVLVVESLVGEFRWDRAQAWATLRLESAQPLLESGLPASDTAELLVRLVDGQHSVQGGV